MIGRVDEERRQAREALKATLDDLESQDFRRRFLALVAKETM
jgi:5-carboxymethyl-2-hydroxymuconate isomerase